MATLFVLGGGTGTAQGPKPGGWLGALPADKQTEAIDRQLRGFDMAMVATSNRDGRGAPDPADDRILRLWP